MSDLRIAMLQYAPKWENAQASLEQLDRLLEQVDQKTDLVILPEMFNTGFSMNPDLVAEDETGITYQWMAKNSMQFALCGSFATKRDNGTYVNRLHLFEQGRLKGHYDKKHLFAMGREDRSFSKGSSPLVLEIRGFKLSFFICYDLRFPEWLRNTYEYDAAVLVASWPSKRVHHWDVLLQARAIENQAYMIGMNRIGTDGNGMVHSGHSQIYQPDGKALLDMHENEAILQATLHLDEVLQTRKKLPFLKDMDPSLLKLPSS